MKRSLFPHKSRFAPLNHVRLAALAVSWAALLAFHGVPCAAQQPSESIISFGKEFAVVKRPLSEAKARELRGEVEVPCEVCLVHVPTQTTLKKLEDFEDGRLSANWRSDDSYVIVRWSGERYFQDAVLLQRHGRGKEASFDEVALNESNLRPLLLRDPGFNPNSKFLYMPEQWDGSHLMVEIIAIEQNKERPHPFAQDEVWYRAKVAIRGNGGFELLELWRTHGSKTGAPQSVWKK